MNKSFPSWQGRAALKGFPAVPDSKQNPFVKAYLGGTLETRLDDIE